MKVKVCGMNDAACIDAVGRLEIDYMGFIFYESSPRYAGALDAECVTSLPPGIKRTGVFVNASPAIVVDRARQFALDTVQLHGEESPELCAMLRSEGFTVIKALSIAGANDFRRADDYDACVDFFLFDTKTPLHGGSGAKFDWSVLKEYRGLIPFFLSGGIGVGDADRVLSVDHPAFYAVDLNSRFETEPGIKDIALLQTFINQLK